MGEKMLRFVVNEVNKMLGTEYNMISFDSLSRNALLQICADCLYKLEAIPKLDLERNTDESLTKILEVLSNIKIPLPSGTNINEFTDGIIQGKRSVVHPTLHWILSNQAEVIKRAYFSKYLKKVNLPLTISSDPDIQPLMIQYENIIQDFKNIHAENAKYAKIGKATIELRKDIEKINNDITKVAEQIEKQKTKVENIPNRESLFVSIKAFRNEVLQEKTLQKQLEEQNGLVVQLESQIKKVSEHLKNQQALRVAPGGLLGRLQEEVQTNRVIAQERLPQEFEVVKSHAQLIEMVATEPQPTHDELADLQSTVDNMSLELQKMLEKTLLTNDPRDDKLAQFRQHATVIANNKQLAADSLMELKEELSLVRRQVEEKENELHKTIGGTMPQGEELKRFVSKLRARSVVYKEHRAQLLELQAEVGVLTRTQDILIQQNYSLAEALHNKDNENKSKEDESAPENVSELSKACKDLAMRINNHKAETALLRQEMQNLKTDNEELSRDHQQSKEVYDSSISNFNIEIKKLENEIGEMEKVIETEEEKWKNIRKEIERKEEILNKLSDDLVQADVGMKKSQKDVLNEKINEQESIGKQLELELQQTMSDKEEREQQVILWHSTLELLKCKKECGENRFD